MYLYQILGVEKGITSVVGSGGKTTLIDFMAKEMIKNSKVIITTTTHVYPFKQYETIEEFDEKKIKEILSEKRCINFGTLQSDSKMIAPSVPVCWLCEFADYVLVEADGSRNKPLKAHNESEPVIPHETDRTILVIGADGLNKPVSQVVHRKEIFCDIAKCEEKDIVTAKMIADVVNRENYGDVIYINKVKDKNRDEAIKLSKLLKKDTFYGALWEGKIYACNH